jgi:NAD(P)-dependent dehydrogenase (short-subunit alcohol dehydrogenase family)
MARFDKKIFIVTGGASLIGFAVARRLTAEGGRVVLSGPLDWGRARNEKRVAGLRRLR